MTAPETTPQDAGRAYRRQSRLIMHYGFSSLACIAAALCGAFAAESSMFMAYTAALYATGFVLVAGFEGRAALRTQEGA